MEESDIIDLEKRYWLLKAQSRTGRFDLETFAPLVSPPIHQSLSEGMGWDQWGTSAFKGSVLKCPLGLNRNNCTEFWKMGKEKSVCWEIWNAEGGGTFLGAGRKYVRFHVEVPCSSLKCFLKDSVKTKWTAGPEWEKMEHFSTDKWEFHLLKDTSVCKSAVVPCSQWDTPS